MRLVCRGLLIVFEGIDGTGKSTQIRMLAEKLRVMGHEVVETREPTDGPFGRKIRELYVNRQSCSVEEELELFMRDRQEHVEQVIKPGLEAGRVILTDRYYFSTAAYQGAAGQDPAEIIRRNETFAPRPDLVLHLVVPVSESLHRIKKLRNDTPNDFEREENLARVAAIFDSLGGDFIKRVDATPGVEAVHAEVLQQVRQLLEQKRPAQGDGRC